MLIFIHNIVQQCPNFIINKNTMNKHKEVQEFLFLFLLYIIN